MYRMCVQTEGRGARIKSKLDPASHDREKPEGEKLCLFQDMRSTGGFGVVRREHNGSIWLGKGAIVGILDTG